MFVRLFQVPHDSSSDRDEVSRLRTENAGYEDDVIFCETKVFQNVAKSLNPSVLE